MKRRKPSILVRLALTAAVALLTLAVLSFLDRLRQ